MTHRVYCIGTE